MPRPRPLTPSEAARTLAHRLGTRVGDNVRQLNTKFGVRPLRVFLVWTRWTGSERGEGDVIVLCEYEILPTPLVTALDNINHSLVQSGVLPMGSLRVSEVSLRLTRDQLMGHEIPGLGTVDHTPADRDFFYEIREDGRGEVGTCVVPQRLKFRLATDPARDMDKTLGWTFNLERISEDRTREGETLVTGGTKLMGP